MGEALGLAVWTQDEAGPYQTRAYPGPSWAPVGRPVCQSHEYIRAGTAKLLTLFHPADGHVCVKGVTSAPNAVLHPWLKEQLTLILDSLPPPAMDTPADAAQCAAVTAALSAVLAPVFPDLRAIASLCLTYANYRANRPTSI